MWIKEERRKPSISTIKRKIIKTKKRMKRRGDKSQVSIVLRTGEQNQL